MLMGDAENLSLVLPQRLDAVGVWDGTQATVFQHRGPVFHKLATARRKGALVLTTEETVYALLRTKFALFHKDTLERVTAEELLRGIVASREFERLLRVHVYLAVVAQGTAVERISKNADIASLDCSAPCVHGDEQRQNQAAAHASHRTIDPSSHGGTALDPDEAITATISNNTRDGGDDNEHNGGNCASPSDPAALQAEPLTGSSTRLPNPTNGKPWPDIETLNDALQRIELDGAKCMPHELLQKFRDICGTIYPVEPVTIDAPIFAIEGAPVYAVTADTMCSKLLGSSATGIKCNYGHSDDGACLDATSNHGTKTFSETEAAEKGMGQISQCKARQAGVPNGNDSCTMDGAGPVGANGRCVVAVSNFDTVYFLDVKNNITY
ncbi:hypothetical protein BBBOND_0310360 [Babesia bigemina]|uniref:Uncharacterized protein n=1 Tax=Babesia bigemina TaxID=5866 RepID=A0A061D9B0_BABBI|nr:hypothetical protein BBBOND_0310360 [Babesia bigemina]CDR97133.1 hypothetical protein BBBOND_0310360 [Babesia bigemina]|eukprot:XP_012769319.1 hypothetical protein BBBOND_0310360 [Babesia bigemina]